MAALIALPATAYADPVPTPDEVVAVMAKHPRFSPDEAGPIDDHLIQTNAKGLLPYNFIVTDVQPASADLAGATVAVYANDDLCPGA
jgi:hypothetical protein